MQAAYKHTCKSVPQSVRVFVSEVTSDGAEIYYLGGRRSAHQHSTRLCPCSKWYVKEVNVFLFFSFFSACVCVRFFCSVVDLPDRFSLFLVMQGIADGRMTVIVFKSNTLFFALWEVTISLILFHTNKWQGLLKIPLGKLANFAFICQFSRWVKKRIAEQSM